MHAAIVELDALTDPVRSAAQYHDFFVAGRLRFALFLVSRIHVGSVGGELGGTGIHAFEYRTHTECMAVGAHRGFIGTQQRRQPRIGKTVAFQCAQIVRVQAFQRASGQRLFLADQVFYLRQEPGVNLAQ